MSREPKDRPHKRKKARAANVVDINDKLLEKLGEQMRSLSHEMGQRLDATVARLLDLYRTWEQENPDRALKTHHKLSMVRYGFVGPAGFTRCHEPHRLPEIAFFLPDGGVDELLDSDIDASKEVMCPAMEAGRCQGAWRAMKVPPCCILLLEVHQGLGGGVMDEGVDVVLSDWNSSLGRDESKRYKEIFARAERLVRKYQERFARREKARKDRPCPSPTSSED